MSNHKSSSWTGQGWQVGEWHAGDQAVLHQPIDTDTDFHQSDRPDICVNIRDPRGGMFPPCLSDEERLAIEGVIRAALQSEFPGAYVDSACVGAGQPGEAAAFGIWTAPPPEPLTEAQKEDMRAGFTRSIGRDPNLTIAFLISARFVSALAERTWKPVRVDDQGNETLDGQNHLNDLRVEMQPPATVATIVEGFNESAVPDAPFTVTIAETFQVETGKIMPPTVVQKLDVDTTLHDILTILSAYNPLALYQGRELRRATAPDKQGVGSLVAEKFLPPALLVKNGMKRPIDYLPPFSVRPDGMFVAGLIKEEEKRQPEVEVAGPSSITAAKGQGVVNGHFHAGVFDLRAPLTYAWTSDAEVVLDPDNPHKVKVRFTPTPDQPRFSQVTVTVTDADGLIATNTKMVNVSVLKLQGPRGQGDSNNPQVEP